VKKVGIFGGTFDPVHLGHLRAAEEFAEGLKLDHVIMVPSANPPHREESPGAGPRDRLEMVRLATRANPRLEASDLEIERGGSSYTVDTLLEIRRRQPEWELFMALGTDAYNDISKWRRPGEVISLAHLVLLTRPGFSVDFLGPLPEALRTEYSREGDMYRHSAGATLRSMSVSALDISAGSIRSLVSRGLSIRYLVHSDVFEYIQRKGIY